MKLESLVRRISFRFRNVICIWPDHIHIFWLEVGKGLSIWSSLDDSSTSIEFVIIIVLSLHIVIFSLDWIFCSWIPKDWKFETVRKTFCFLWNNSNLWQTTKLGYKIHSLKVTSILCNMGFESAHVISYTFMDVIHFQRSNRKSSSSGSLVVILPMYLYIQIKCNPFWLL